MVAYSIFDPTSLPKSNEADFKTYGENHVSVLADHFFVNDTEKEKLKYSGEDLSITCMTS